VSSIVSAERAEKISRVCTRRTRHVVVVLEDVLDNGNENAVLRSADALGFQVVHVISNNYRNEEIGRKIAKRSRINKVSARTDVGCRQWLDVIHWSSSERCIKQLENDNYLIALADPEGDCDIRSISLNAKVAMVFGNESLGLSDTMYKAAQLTFSLPMYGFVNSFNVSVAAAIAMYDVHLRLQDHHFLCKDQQLQLFEKLVKQSKGLP
jgi:tRNA (guanosine-2'-O-)-methyltransferase